MRLNSVLLLRTQKTHFGWNKKDYDIVTWSRTIYLENGPIRTKIKNAIFELQSLNSFLQRNSVKIPYYCKSNLWKLLL